MNANGREWKNLCRWYIAISDDYYWMNSISCIAGGYPDQDVIFARHLFAVQNSTMILSDPHSRLRREAFLSICEQELILKDEVYQIVGAAMEVANQLGSGFLEAVYQESMEIELSERGIPYSPQKRIDIYYKGNLLNKEYIADFLCHDCIIVEIKAIKKITEVENAQLLNYLKATNLPLGLIFNFGTPKLDWARFANTRRKR